MKICDGSNLELNTSCDHDHPSARWQSVDRMAALPGAIFKVLLPILLMVSAIQAEESVAETVAEPLPWILRPYEVQVELSFRPVPGLSGRESELTARCETILQGWFNEMWSLTVSSVGSTQPFSSAELVQLDDESAAARWNVFEQDKLFLVTIDRTAIGYQVDCREWDAATRTLGAVYHEETAELRELAAVMARAVGEAFRPLVEIETMTEEKIEVLTRAGELPPRRPQFAQFQPGDQLVPVLRYLDRNRNVQRVQPLPWTFLTVSEIERSRMTVSLTSTFRMPIPRSRRRVEVLALRVRPHLAETSARIFPRGSPLNPLVGYRCEVMNRLPTEDDPVDDRLKLSTNRQGVVSIPADPEHPLQFLHIYSGKALLARVPLIPGDVPRVEIEVPDDRARLNVEGEVSLLQGELIDIVATREVLMARTRGAIQQSRWEDIDRFLQELRKLPTLQQFQARVEVLQVRAVYDARQAKDRVAESRIRRLCAGINESAEKHLDPFRVEEFRREIEAQRPKSQS